jgi:transposase
MTQEEEIAHLTKQFSELMERFKEAVEQVSKAQERESHLLAQMSVMQAENQAPQEQLAVAHKRIEELEKQKTPPPAFVKANRRKPVGEKKPRKKRAAQYNHARQRAAPTQVVEHRIKHCPVCANALGGISVARRRQVIELPPPPPVEITEHVVYHGWCSHCQKWREAPLEVSSQVLGQGRIGVKIASLLGYLRTVMRLPLRQIQGYLATLHGLRLSVGDVAEVLHRLTGRLAPVLTELKAAIRASPAVQADETGWRENGQNGYIWSASTPQVRYYEYHHSRG